MKKILSFLLLGMLCSIGMVKADTSYYTPTADEVIILNDVYDANATTAGYSTHAAVLWGGTASSNNKKAGDPENDGASTSSNVPCYSIKNNGGGKNISLLISGCSQVILYHEKRDGYMPKLTLTPSEGSATTLSGSKNVYFNEFSLDGTKSYSITIQGTKGSDQQDSPYLYAIKLIKFVPSAPTITTQPQSANYATGQTIAALNVVATASAGTLSYQWYSCEDAEKTNAAAIDGATSASYTPTAAGFYYVKVTDSNGNIDSDVAQITVSAAEAPTITTDLAATAEVTVGLAQEFSIVATGNPAPTYQWYKDGVAIVGATAATYSYNADAAGSVVLYCAATNTSGTTNSVSCTVTATLPAAPVITTDLPTSANAFVGKPMLLGVVATSVVAMTYQWYLDGAAIVGATSASYTYIPEQAGTNSLFCIVTNAGGETWSQACSVITAEPTYLSGAYSTDIPEDFVMPNWMAYSSKTAINTVGVLFNNAYSGGDKEKIGTSVLRLQNVDTLYLYIQGAGLVSVNVSATGTRTVKMLAGGDEIANTGSFSKNTLKTVAGRVSGENNIVKLHMVNANGGLSIGAISFIPDQTITLGANGWSTYATDYKTTVSGATIYKAAYNETSEVVDLTAVASNAIIPANAGIILKGDANDEVTIAAASGDAADFEDNKLVGVVEATAAPANAYVISTNAGVTAFNPCQTALEIPAHKAYLVIENAPATAPIRIVGEENNATDIQAVEGNDEVVKFMENGQLFIRKNGVVYDVTGQVVH